MTSAEPARPAAPRPREVAASVLAALQLVEDARSLGNPGRRRRRRRRVLAAQTVASRRLALNLPAG